MNHDARSTLFKLIVSYHLSTYVPSQFFNEQLEQWAEGRIALTKEDRTGDRLIAKNILESQAFLLALYATIIANSVFVILQIVDQDNDTYNHINYVFSGVFALEMGIKWYAYGFFGYWRNPLNAFDGTLVLLTAMELILTAYNDDASGRVGGVRPPELRHAP